MLWDTLCTFDDEVETLWKTKLNLGVWLYALTRYGTLLFLFCQVFQDIQVGEFMFWFWIVP